MKKYLLLSTAILFAVLSLKANNLQISDGIRVSDNEISFTLSWENSWNVGGSPGNHDAIWVFVKYRECGGSGPYIHALLSTTMSDYQFDSRLEAAMPVSLNNRSGVLPGGATQTNGLGNNNGIMIKRSDFGKGDISSATCVLKVVSASGTPFPMGINYEIKVIGIEMVYVRDEPFLLGDGSSLNAFIVTTIGSEDLIAANTLLATHAEIPAEYPKGFSKFYCMKYEITEGQYYKFLNSGSGLASSPADFTGLNRNNLTVSGTSTPDRAQNFMTWGDLTAYLDWAALRPITELEYEKASKGTGIFAANGYAWGTAAYQRVLYISGTEDGTETASTINANAHCYQQFPTIFTNTGTTLPPGYKNSVYIGSNANRYIFSAISSPTCEAITPIYPAILNYSSGYRMYTPLYMCGSALSQGWGPVGAGIFARDATLDRETTGGAYYGIMEMSGNVAEQCVDITSTGYTGEWGNGYLLNGAADAAGWPSPTSGRCLRGGGYALPAVNMKVCDRTYNNNTSTGNGPITADWWRRGTVGGRGGR